MWCPKCGDEFRDGFRRCNYCNAELVAVRPPSVEVMAEPDPVPTDHVLLEYDLSDWSDDRREGLNLQLRLAAIPAEWEDGSVLVVGRVWQDEVDDLVDFVDREANDDRQHDLRVDENTGFIVAGPGRRFLGGVVDEVVALPVSALVLRIVPVSSIRPVLGLVMSVVFWILPVALYGRTIGKLVVGTRVMRIDGLAPPGWRVAGVRWGVLAVPGLLVILFGVVGVFVGWAVAAIVYAPILGRTRRGLHDRAARTRVVLTQRTTRFHA